jgi:RNA polymerase sigma factor (sigma-70 family)
VRQRIGEKQDAEEVVQNALLTIVQEYKGVEFKTSFAAWAYKVLDNRILAHYQASKRQAARSERLNETVDASELAGANPLPELRHRLLSCLNKIMRANRRYARILNLHYQGYTTGEICGKMELTPNNFYSVLSRARSQLGFCLDTGRID